MILDEVNQISKAKAFEDGWWSNFDRCIEVVHIAFDDISIEKRKIPPRHLLLTNLFSGSGCFVTPSRQYFEMASFLILPRGTLWNDIMRPSTVGWQGINSRQDHKIVT